jgi:glycerol-3-phosphate dehydrogenase
MPWHDSMLIGTTETPYVCYPARVQPLAVEEEYLLAVARRYMTTCRNLTRNDITTRFAGLRVLPAASESAFNRSRETIFTTDRDTGPRVLSIYGGKLTGWRAAAAHVLGVLRVSLPVRTARASTSQLPLRRMT